MFCRECATNMHAEDRFCVKCGAGQAVEAYADSAVYSTTATNSFPATYSEELSQWWIERFALIEKAGGPDYVRDLPYWERRKVLTNWCGFFFCFFYYLFLGMWKKGIVLALLCMAGSIILIVILSVMGVPASIVNRISWGLSAGVAGVFRYRANIDYYNKVMLGENGWW